MELSRKDEHAVTKVAERAKPTFVTIAGKQFISTGKWNNILMAEYVLLHGRDKWLTVGELAKVAYLQNTTRSKKQARKCVSSLFTQLLVKHGMLLAIEYGKPNNRAVAVKMFDNKSEPDRQAIKCRLERMRKRQELTAEQYERALVVVQEVE